MTLIITGLTAEQAKQLAGVVLEIAEEDPSGHYECIVKGLEDLPIEEIKRIFREIFPLAGVAS